MSVKKWGGRLAMLLASDRVRDKRIFLLAWPVMAEMFLQTLTQMVDMAMVGRLGRAAIASIGLSMRPLFVAQAIFLGLGVATTAMVARFIGAKDRERATIAAEQSMLTTSVLALALAAFGYYFARQIILFMGAEPEVVELGISYLRGFSPGIFFLMLSTIMTAALRASGDTRTSFYAGMISNAINVVGNYLLIFGHLGFPALGVYGAAIATSFSRLVMAAILFVSLLRGQSGLHLTIKGFTYLDWDIIVRLFRIGVPAALERLVQSVSMMLHLRLLAVLGTTAVAVSTLSSNVEQLSFMPSIGFSVAASTLVGQSLGAKKPDEAEHNGWGAMRLACMFMGTMGLLFILVPGFFIRIYTSDPDVLLPGMTILRIVGITQLPQAIAFVASGILRGAGDTRTVLNNAIIGNIALRLGLSYLFIIVLGWGMWSAFVAILMDWLVRGVLLSYWVAQGKWKTTKV
ncbi:MAG TPA: MATE family efflux transporter [Bacillota bacterium]|nr:MATE family efflux transporter [Bacillota bacterium]